MVAKGKAKASRLAWCIRPTEQWSEVGLMLDHCTSPDGDIIILKEAC